MILEYDDKDSILGYIGQTGEKPVCFLIFSCRIKSYYDKYHVSLVRISLSSMYHQQQNKWYPKGFHLPISKLYSILALK